MYHYSPCFRVGHTDKFYYHLQRNSYAEIAFFLRTQMKHQTFVFIIYFILLLPSLLLLTELLSCFFSFFLSCPLTHFLFHFSSLSSIPFSLYSSSFLLVMFPLRLLTIQKVLQHHAVIIEVN